MALVPIIGSSDGVRITVNDMVKSPKLIPRRVLSLMQNNFIADSILRDAGQNDAGVAYFFQSQPLFADYNSSIREEWGEYQIVTTSDGTPTIATSVDRGLSIKVSDEMRRRNQVDRVNTQLTMVKNTLVRDWDLAFQTAILGSVATVLDVSGTRPWDGTGTTPTIRKDILTAKKAVNTAVSSAQTNNYFGFMPDTIVMSPVGQFDITSDPTFNTVYQGNNSDENLLYTGKLPRQILDLDPLVSLTWPDNYVLICERKTIGFISDEQSLRSTPLYRDESHKTWRADVNRQSLMGIDQPLAGALIKIHT
jgi:hypothetical protein